MGNPPQCIQLVNSFHLGSVYPFIGGCLFFNSIYRGISDQIGLKGVEHVHQCDFTIHAKVVDHKVPALDFMIHANPVGRKPPALNLTMDRKSPGHWTL